MFEWGKVFFRQEGQTRALEKNAMAAVMSGWAQSRKWYAEARAADFYDLKGVTEALLKKLGVRQLKFRRGAGRPWYSPDDSAALCLQEQTVGRLGRVAPEVIEAFDIDGETVFLLELDIAGLSEYLPHETKFKPFARFPAVYRDISLLVGRNVESGRIIEIIKAEGGQWVERVDVFDLYQGEKLGSSEKAIAFRICYRSRKGTLEGDEVNRLHGRVVRRIREKTGGKLREG
jgi:phenylalanyl-tRNA synthetase beta chain